VASARSTRSSTASFSAVARYIPELDLWRCPGCKKNLPGASFSIFRRSKTGELGISNLCKLCTKVYQARKPPKPLRKNPSYNNLKALRFWSKIDH
jgi:hypothetical protein